jgi:hypothetical protein
MKLKRTTIAEEILKAKLKSSILEIHLSVNILEGDKQKCSSNKVYGTIKEACEDFFVCEVYAGHKDALDGNRSLGEVNLSYSHVVAWKMLRK